MAETPTPEQVVLVRRRYLERATLKAIVAESGIKNPNIISRCLAGDFADGSGVSPAPIPRRRPARRRKGGRAALVARMWRTAERQVEEIEERLQAAGLELAERESNARTLAIVAKTLREFAAVDETERLRKGKQSPPDHDIDDDPVPRDIDEFRRELARRIDALIESRTDAGGAGAAE